MAYDWLKDRHPIHVANADEWKRRERLLRGGADVIETDLEKFSWEEEDDFSKRKGQAVYPGFGEAFVRTLVGHVLRNRPEATGEGAALSFGGMGSIERDEGQRDPSMAELVYYNINGTGNEGQQFWQWIGAVFERAGATGLRWCMVETPPWLNSRNVLDSDVIAGQRPYAVEFSPRVVSNWGFDRGRLDWCVIRIRQDTRRIVDGKIEGAANAAGYYLLVRTGYDGLGDEFNGGGWWKFDEERERIPDEAGGHGLWDKTAGEIPVGLAVWQWEDQTSVGDETALPLARSATTSLDNLSVAYMNLKSAWRSNAWRSAGAPDYLMGVSTEAWQVVEQQYKGGTGLIGVPPSEGNSSPTLSNGSASLVAAESFKALLDDMTSEAERMMVQMTSSTPDSSGRSKEAGFTETKAPRLTLLSENMEAFLNTMLRFFELRFGIAQPTAYVTMPREFDLQPVEADIRDFFDTFRRSQLRSATLESEAMVRLAESKGLVSDENREPVRTELQESARASAAAGAQEGGLLDGIFGGGAGGEGGE